ncbi:MAG: TolC family protein [Bacteroidetes bacterium]|nr:TolC family protein [Bacteroidota bacterium]
MKKASFTLLILLLSVFAVSAQDLLTIDRAIEIGLSNNYGIIIAKNSRQISENNASPGNAGMLPKIDLNAGYSHGLSNAKVTNMAGYEINNPTANSDLFTAGINLNWTVFDGLKMFIKYDKLKKLEEIGDLNVKISVENTLARIMAAYYEIIRQEKETEILKEQVGISEFRLDLAKLKYETGSGSELEFLKASVELNADISNLSNQKTVYMNSLATLNELMARDVTSKFGVKDTILINYQLNYDSLRAGMREANRNLLLYNRNVDVSVLNMKSARAVQWPTLGLTTGINYLNSQTEASITNYNRNFGAVVGVTAYMNIFDGLNMQRDYRNAKISYASSELEVKQLENHLEAHLLKIYNEYMNQLQLITFEKESVAMAGKNMEIARESFEVGAISSLQLREIQKNLLDANTRLVDAEFRTKLTETALLLISGKLLK